MGSTKITPAGLRQQVLDIETRVGFNAPISTVQEKQLFRKLDRVQSSVEKLQGQGASDFLEDLPDKITQLYGTIHNRTVESQVERVVIDAKHLQAKLEEGSNIDQGVDKLKKRLDNIRKEHALGQDQLKVTGYVSTKANQYLKARSLGKEAPQLVNQFNLLELQNIHYRNDEIDEDTAGELFEMAEAYYYRQNKDLNKRYHLLPQKAKERLSVHFERLGIRTPAEDGIKAAQAFVATAYDLAEGEDAEPYFSVEQLRDLFAEARTV
jgi:hypothetical protein